MRTLINIILKSSKNLLTIHAEDNLFLNTKKSQKNSRLTLAFWRIRPKNVPFNSQKRLWDTDQKDSIFLKAGSFFALNALNEILNLSDDVHWDFSRIDKGHFCGILFFLIYLIIFRIYQFRLGSKSF